MRYIKLILSSILALMIAVVVIWTSLFIVLFSVLSAPIITWWVARKVGADDISPNSPKNKDGTSVSYKVIEAKYEIIDK